MRLHQNHHVAIQPGASGQVQPQTAIDCLARKPVCRALHGAAGQRPRNRDRQRQRVLRLQRGLRYLLRLQPCQLCVSVPGRDRGRDGQPQAPLLECQQLREPHLENHLITGLEVADVGRVQPIGQCFKHHRCIALGQRLFVLPLGLALGDDGADLALAVEFGGEAQQHGLVRQREGVDQLQHAVAWVAVGLAQRQLEQHTVEAAVRLHASKDGRRGACFAACQTKRFHLIVHLRSP